MEKVNLKRLELGEKVRNPADTRKGCGKLFEPNHFGITCGEISPLNDKIMLCDDCKKKETKGLCNSENFDDGMADFCDALGIEYPLKETKGLCKCECGETGVLREGMAELYFEEELPYVNHKPNECKCTNDLKQYIRDGKKIWLCSNCCMLGDEEQSIKNEEKGK